MSELVLRGRSSQIMRLAGILARVRTVGQGAIVLMAGEPGIGKTALLRVLGQKALAQGFAVGFGKADEVSQIAPGAAVLQALHTGSSPLLTEEGFRSLAPLYNRPLWLVEAMVELLELRSQQSPVLVVVDDVQWADRLSLFALRTLSGRLADVPIVWAIGTRSRIADASAQFESAGQHDGPALELMDLQRLNDDEVLAVAADVLGAPPAGRHRRWLHLAGGNPFWTVQLAEGIALERKRGGAGDELPEALGTTIRSRTRVLDGDTRAALHLAAVWGRPLDISDAAQMLDINVASFEGSLARASALGLTTDSHDPIEFRHDLMRELVYHNLSEADRTRLHGVCAAHMVSVGRSAVDAAPHARLAAGRGDQVAAQILRRAALECIDSMPRTAADLILEAFRGVSAQDPEWFVLGGQCAELLIQAQHGADAVGVIDRLLLCTQDPDQRARLQVLAAEGLWLTGAAEELAARVEGELFTSSAQGALRARLDAARSLALTRIGTGAEALTAAEKAMERGRELHDRETQLLALRTLGEVAKNEGRHLRAYEVFHQLRVTFGPGYIADEITSLQFIDRFDDAQALLSQVSRGRGQRSTAELPALVRAQLWQNFKLAHFDVALTDAQLLLDIGDELGNFMHRLDARVVMSTIAVVHGDIAQARDIVAVAREELDTRDAVHSPGLILAQARIAAAELNFEEGARLLKPLMASDSTLRTYWPRLLDQMRLGAGIAVAAGDRTFARETVARAASAARRNPGIDSFAGVALQVRGFVLDDLDSLEQAVKLLGRSPRPVILATALTDHGALLLRQGHRRRGVAQLEAARKIYDGLRAAPALAQLQVLLEKVDAGAGTGRRNSKPVSGWGSLTYSELLVARLIGQGQTNRATAETLNISPNTVAAHLKAVFAKMDVHSRVQLVNAMPVEQSDI